MARESLSGVRMEVAPGAGFPLLHRTTLFQRLLGVFELCSPGSCTRPKLPLCITHHIVPNVGKATPKLEVLPVMNPTIS